MKTVFVMATIMMTVIVSVNSAQAYTKSALGLGTTVFNPNPGQVIFVSERQVWN